MTRARRTVETIAAAALALCLGAVGAGALNRTAVHDTGVTLATLSGRHLEPPWWTEVHVDQAGPVETITVPAEVLFPYDSAAIGSGGQATLRSIAPDLVEAEQVVVAGCTDASGGIDSPYNIALSRSRALAAVAVLEAADVPSSIVHTEAWADTHPVTAAPGLDAETLAALDRRIVIQVTK